MKNNKLLNAVCLAGTMFFLSACSTFLGVGKDNTMPPTPLKSYHVAITPKQRWTVSPGSGAGHAINSLVLALSDNQLFTADNKGHVFALQASNGHLLWEVDLKKPLSAGPAAGNGVVLIAGDKADIFAISQTTHQIIWHKILSDAISAPPVIAGDKAIIKTLDGKISALDLANGSDVWQYAHGAPMMVLAGGSKPQFANNIVFNGYADGKLAAYKLTSGQLLWETQVAMPAGASEVEQMVDIVASPVLQQDVLYTVTYQGQLAAVNATNGNILWSQALSSYTGIALSGQSVYVTDVKGDIWAFNQRNGQLQWHQDALRYRKLTAPVVMGNSLVVGDGEGYLHWLNLQTGMLVGRVSNSSSAIVATPVVNGSNLCVLSKNGRVSCFGE